MRTLFPRHYAISTSHPAGLCAARPRPRGSASRLGAALGCVALLGAGGAAAAAPPGTPPAAPKAAVTPTAPTAPPAPPVPAGSLDATGDPALTETSDADQRFRPGDESQLDAQGELLADESATPNPGRESTLMLRRGFTADLSLTFGQARIYALGEKDVENAGFALYPKEAAFAFTVDLDLGYALSERWWLGVRLPWSTDSVDGTGSQAFGSPQVAGQYTFTLTRELSLPIVLEIGLPLAGGNPDPTASDPPGLAKAHVQEFADAVTGFQDGELYAIDRLGFTAAVELQYQSGPLGAFIWTKLSAQVHTGAELKNATTADGTFVLNGQAFRSVTTAGGRYLFAGRYVGGLDVSAVVDAERPVTFESTAGAAPPSAFQFVLAPSVGVNLTSDSTRLMPTLAAMLPLGGARGGKSWGLTLGAAGSLE